MAGLYLHVPFCRHHCAYCDFNVLEGAEALMPRYVAALRADLTRVAAAGPAGVAPSGAVPAGSWPVFTSVFVGGGTPTLLAPQDLAGILELVAAVLPLAPDAEISVEANPETVAVASLRPLVAAGLTRLSIGAQSFAPAVLAALDRDHDASKPLAAVAAARAAGVRHVNLDLIYGSPAETDRDWRASLTAAIQADIDHVSCYALTVEPNTIYGTRVRRGEALAPDEDVQAARMATADLVLTAAGFARYEVSNWARPGAESRHNATYWAGGDWLGVGAGAHAHWQGRRWWSTRPPGRYVEQVLAGRSSTAGEELLDAGARRTERLLLGLRTREGVVRADVAPLDDAAVSTLESAGLLRDDGTRLALTPAGLAVADGITVRLLG